MSDMTSTTTSDPEHLRILEALLFAATEPLDEGTLAARLPAGADVAQALASLRQQYQGRGVELVPVAGGWRFQTAEDLSHVLIEERVVQKKLSQAALETLAIIAYHQPVTRAEIEHVRGVSISKGVLDTLLEINWVRIRGRRQSPGRPVTFGVTDQFLAHFGLQSLADLPGFHELKAMGLMEARVEDLPDLQKMPLFDGPEDEDTGAEPEFMTDYAAAEAEPTS